MAKVKTLLDYCKHLLLDRGEYLNNHRVIFINSVPNASGLNIDQSQCSRGQLRSQSRIRFSNHYKELTNRTI